MVFLKFIVMLLFVAITGFIIVISNLCLEKGMHLSNIYYDLKDEAKAIVPTKFLEKSPLNNIYERYYNYIKDTKKYDELLMLLILIQNLNKILPHRKYLFKSDMTIDSLNDVYYKWLEENEYLVDMKKMRKYIKCMLLINTLLLLIFIYGYGYGYDKLLVGLMVGVIIIFLIVYLIFKIEFKSLSKLIYNTDYHLNNAEQKSNMDFLLLKLLKVNKSEEIISMLEESNYHYDILHMKTILNAYSTNIIDSMLKKKNHTREMYELLGKIKSHLIEYPQSHPRTDLHTNQN